MRRLLVILLAATVLGWFSWKIAQAAQSKILERGLVIEELCR